MDLSATTTMLARTPVVLKALLEGLPQRWLHRADGPGTWSAYDIVGHLLHAELTNWVPRIGIIREHGSARPLTAFDREAMLAWRRQPVGALLERFADARQASLRTLSALALTSDDLHRRGHHPQIGDVTIGHTVAAWVAHDLTHLGQTGEVLARDYRDDTGPYRPFMPALDRVAEAE